MATTARDRADYLQAARDGFAGVPYDGARHGLLTSAMHACYVVGAWLQETGRCAPRDVRPSRGDTMRCNDMLLRLDWRNVKFPTITRER